MLNKPLTKFNTHPIKTKNLIKNMGIGGYFFNMSIKTHTHTHIHTYVDTP